MALVYSGLSNWTDESRLDFYLDAVASNDVLPFVRQYGQVITGVKADTIKLPKLSTSVTIADGTACFTDIDGNNDSTISQSSITLSKGLVRDQICVHGLEDYYTAQGLTAGQNYTGLGAFEAGIMQSVAGEVGKAIGSAMWAGSTNFISSGWTDLIYAATFGTSNVGTSTPTSGGSAGTDAGTIILSRRGNFVAALDLESDFTNVVMGLDQYQENIWWKFRFKAGVGFRDLSGNSIKYWGPAT